MVNSKLLTQFLWMFPHLKKEIDLWIPNNKHSIRIRFTNHREYIFHYINESEWCFETLKSYHQRMKRS